MDENDLREAMRTTMTLAAPPPPMASATALSAGRRAVRRRATLTGAGITAALVAVAAVAVQPDLRLLSGDDGGAPWAGAAVPSAHPDPSASKPVWPADGNGEPQEDATARSGERYEQGRRLLDAVLAVVPDGWTVPTGEDPEGLPLRYHQAQVEGDNTGSTWGYLAQAAIARDGRTGRLLAEVHTAGNGLPREPCALAREFREPKVQGHCEVVTVGRAKVGVVTPPDDEAGLDQWAAYRHSDGVVVYIAQGRKATAGQHTLPGLASRPLPARDLATLATAERFHLA